MRAFKKIPSTSQNHLHDTTLKVRQKLPDKEEGQEVLGGILKTEYTVPCQNYCDKTAYILERITPK